MKFLRKLAKFITCDRLTKMAISFAPNHPCQSLIDSLVKDGIPQHIAIQFADDYVARSGTPNAPLITSGPPPQNAMRTPERGSVETNLNTKMRKGQISPGRLLRERLRIDPGQWTFPFKFYGIFVDEEKAYFYYLSDGEIGTLVDDADLFPSDNLLAKLKVLLKATS